MPKQVDEMVEALLSDPKFYPEKSEKQQESIAWAIAWSKYNKKNKRKKKSLHEINKIVTALENQGMSQEAGFMHEMFLKVAQSQDYPKVFKFINNPPNIIIFAEDPGPYYVYEDGQRTNFSSSNAEEIVNMAKENFSEQEIALVYMLDTEFQMLPNSNYGMRVKPAYFYHNGNKKSFPGVEIGRAHV